MLEINLRAKEDFSEFESHFLLDLVNKHVTSLKCLSLGSAAWPSGVFLKYTAGDQLGPVNLVSVKPLDAGEYYDISVNMISPGKTGMYQGQWRMCTPSGQFFGGEKLYIQVNTVCIPFSLFIMITSC